MIFHVYEYTVKLYAIVLFTSVTKTNYQKGNLVTCDVSFRVPVKQNINSWGNALPTTTDLRTSTVCRNRMQLNYLQIHVHPVSNRSVARHSTRIAIEGFGGKRVLGILRKIELCQKRSKFRMQFCLGVLNNVLHVFPEACFLFEILGTFC